MPESKSVVYLEDLEAPRSSPAVSVSGEKENTLVASKTVTKSTEDASDKTTVTKTANKRQATLMDMFSGGGSQPSKKKMRVEASTSSITSTPEASSSGTKAGKAGQTLNSIPFSLTEYTASLSDEEKRLLSLECETMGKSWSVRSHDLLPYGNE